MQNRKTKFIAFSIVVMVLLQIILPIIPLEVLAVDDIPDSKTWDVSENQDESVIATWKKEDSSLTISGNGNMKDMNSTTFWGNVRDDIKKVIIEEGVTSIEYSAFYGCSSLERIEIPEGVTSIGEFTFRGCSSLASIEIPEGVTSIDSYAFKDCSSLVNIEIPEGVTSIEYSTFENCSSLVNIEIPEGVTSIKAWTFRGCSSLESIAIPASVETIGEDIFSSGNKTVIYTKTDSVAHKYAVKNKLKYTLDDTAPEVVFEINGNNTASKTQETKVNITDKEVGVKEQTLKYKWTQSTEKPEEKDFTERFKNGQTIKKSEGNGEWYLWILAKDKLGNSSITRSEAFLLDSNATDLYPENKGDINEDGKIDTTDMLKVVRHMAANKSEETAEKHPDWVLIDEKMEIADINSDGKIDTTDMLKVVRHIAASKSEETAEKYPDWIIP